MFIICVIFLGNPEPAIIPLGNALRTLKWRNALGNKRHQDVLTSLMYMKNENEYKDILHDMGCEPFFFTIIVLNKFTYTEITVKIPIILNLL